MYTRNCVYSVNQIEACKFWTALSILVFNHQSAGVLRLTRTEQSRNVCIQDSI